MLHFPQGGCIQIRTAYYNPIDIHNIPISSIDKRKASLMMNCFIDRVNSFSEPVVLRLVYRNSEEIKKTIFLKGEGFRGYKNGGQ